MSILLRTILLSLGLLQVFTPAYAASDCVILLHGLARGEASMTTMEHALTDKGFTVRNVSYPSRDYPIEQLATMVISPALQDCADTNQTHFVTHSLGGILVRQYLQQHEVENLGRVVMLGPPNHGSELVDSLAGMPGFELLNGEAGLQLGTQPESVPMRLGAVSFDLGVIAGNRTYNPIYSSIIPGEDDGKVSVASTKVEGMSDHIELPVSHTFMMNDEQVIQQTERFLRDGKFLR
jgi:pimeloyl-ACP methyl ester carboxylesterase